MLHLAFHQETFAHQGVQVEAAELAAGHPGGWSGCRRPPGEPLTLGSGLYSVSLHLWRGGAAVRGFGQEELPCSATCARCR